jgi:hypothetical protein
MSTESEQREFERYLEYQRMQRSHRVETLGGAATVLFLSTVDLGLSGASDPLAEASVVQTSEMDHTAEVIPLRAVRQRRLAEFATESAELGYAQAV